MTDRTRELGELKGKVNLLENKLNVVSGRNQELQKRLRE